jgi:hypothetical protein
MNLAGLANSKKLVDIIGMERGCVGDQPQQFEKLWSISRISAGQSLRSCCG